VADVTPSAKEGLPEDIGRTIAWALNQRAEHGSSGTCEMPTALVGVAMTNTFDEYVEKAARLVGRRPPADLAARLAELLERRPDLAGLGVSYVLEAVCA